MYCPDWIFDIVCAEVASLFIKNDVALNLGARKYALGLSEEYKEMSADEMELSAEAMVRVLGEIEAGELAVSLLEGFSYFRLYYSFQGVKRNLKPMFGNSWAGIKEKEYSVETTPKRFKAYLFAHRSDKAVLSPHNWSLTNQTEIPFLAEIASKNSNPLDFL